MVYVVCSAKCHSGVMEYPDTYWEVEPQFDEEDQPLPPRRCGNCGEAMRPATEDEMPVQLLAPVMSWGPALDLDEENLGETENLDEDQN